jgi:hypothetical protein
LTTAACRECGRRAAETGTPVSAGAVAFTCSTCLLTGADSLPTCRRCLGAHWDARCDYTAAEAQAAFSARRAAREGHQQRPHPKGSGNRLRDGIAPRKYSRHQQPIWCFSE